MSKPLILKKAIDGEINYWLSLRNIIGDDMPEDMCDILVHIFSTRKETAWTKKCVEKRALHFRYEKDERNGCFKMPNGKIKIVFKNGKIIDLNEKDENDTNH